MIGNNFLLCLFGTLAYFLSSTDARLAIIGGEKANHIRYQAILLINGNFACGAAIIGNEHILTAAHCVVGHDGHANVGHMTVITGTSDRKRTGKQAVTVGVLRICVPSQFTHSNATFLKADIAVLKVKPSLGLAHRNNLKALELPMKKDTYAGNTAVISGFGWTWFNVYNAQERGGHNDTHLRFAKARIVTNAHCNELYTRREISKKIVCAKTMENEHAQPRSVCKGDSGGPLVYDENTIVGILSTAPKHCSETKYPAMYTRVSSFLDFIERAVEGTACEKTVCVCQ